MNNQKISELISRAKEAYKREGFYYVIHSGIKLIYNQAFYSIVNGSRIERNNERCGRKSSFRL